MARNTIQYDHMYVQTTLILVFRCTNKNCCVKIIEHTKANFIMSTCTFLFYHNITVHASLVTTNDSLYRMNWRSPVEFITVKLFDQHILLASLIGKIYATVLYKQLRSNLLEVIPTAVPMWIYFLIQHTFNFVTEWIYNKMTMSYYREDTHILRLPSQVILPDLSIRKTNTDNIYIESKPPAISLHKLYAFVNRLQNDDLHITKANKNRMDNRLLNQSLTGNMDDTEDILDIGSWFNDEIQSSMIFSFISCIIAIIAFIFLLFLCYNMRNWKRYSICTWLFLILQQLPRTLLHVIEVIFICTSFQLFVWYFFYMSFLGYCFDGTDNFVATTRLYIYNVCMDMIKVLRLPWQLNWAICQRLLMSRWRYRLHFYQYMMLTIMIIMLCQEIGFMIFLKLSGIVIDWYAPLPPLNLDCSNVSS